MHLVISIGYMSFLCIPVRYFMVKNTLSMMDFITLLIFLHALTLRFFFLSFRGLSIHATNRRLKKRVSSGCKEYIHSIILLILLLLPPGETVTNRTCIYILSLSDRVCVGIFCGMAHYAYVNIQFILNVQVQSYAELFFSLKWAFLFER